MHSVLSEFAKCSLDKYDVKNCCRQPIEHLPRYPVSNHKNIDKLLDDNKELQRCKRMALREVVCLDCFNPITQAPYSCLSQREIKKKIMRSRWERRYHVKRERHMH